MVRPRRRNPFARSKARSRCSRMRSRFIPWSSNGKECLSSSTAVKSGCHQVHCPSSLQNQSGHCPSQQSRAAQHSQAQHFRTFVKKASEAPGKRQLRQFTSVCAPSISIDERTRWGSRRCCACVTWSYLRWRESTWHGAHPARSEPSLHRDSGPKHRRRQGLSFSTRKPCGRATLCPADGLRCHRHPRPVPKGVRTSAVRRAPAAAHSASGDDRQRPRAVLRRQLWCGTLGPRKQDWCPAEVPCDHSENWPSLRPSARCEGRARRRPASVRSAGVCPVRPASG